MVPITGYFGTSSLSLKGTQHSNTFIIESFHMFSIRIWDDKINVTNLLSIKCNNGDKRWLTNFQNEGLNESIINFVLYAVLQRVGLS